MPTIARPDAAHPGFGAGFRPPCELPAVGKLSPDAKPAAVPYPFRLEAKADSDVAIAVTHDEVDRYARRLRERCDRTLAVVRS